MIEKELCEKENIEKNLIKLRYYMYILIPFIFMALKVSELLQKQEWFKSIFSLEQDILFFQASTVTNLVQPLVNNAVCIYFLYYYVRKY